ncbi:MAG TPA: tetratricopeptide repeat protein [Candidatus Acidoferrales bacterium]|nr:tetratricopeptide repeat protein [Candidatus Acidoferrales bacterium]
MFGRFASWGIFGLLLMGLAILHFTRKRPDSYWLFIIIFLGPPGALIYLLVEAAPELGDPGAFSFVHRRSRIGELRAAIRDNPSPGNYEELGQLYLDSGRWSEARDAYNHSITKRTDSPDPFYRRALAEIALGDLAAARTDLEFVVSKDSGYDFQRAPGLLAYVYGRTGEIERARQLYEAVLRVSTLTETQLHYAEFLAGQGQRPEAREMLQKILDKRANMPGFLRRRERPLFRQARLLLATL